MNTKDTQLSYNINESVIEDYFKNKHQKKLFLYSTIVLLSSGKGYISIVDYKLGVQKLCGKSEKTVNRWITILKKSKLIKIRRGVLYPLGRSKMELGHNTTHTYIKFTEEHLKSFNDFQNHVIRQIALMIQNRFKYAWTKMKHMDAGSLQNSGKIETEMERVNSRKQCGCSISKIVEKLDVAKSTISVALRGYTKKQSNCKKMSGQVARSEYRSLLDGITYRSSYLSPKWSYKYNKKTDTYQLCYALASQIVVESYLKRKKYRRA